MADVKIILPDGSAKEYAAGTTLGEAVKQLSNSLAKKVLAANVNGELTDLREELVDGSEVAFLTFEEDGGKHTLRHTASHILAQAVKRLWPEAKLAIGPAIDKGFYYDIDMEHTLTPEDLGKIEKEMSRIVKENLPITKSVMSRQEAIEFFKSKNEDYKVELIQDLPEDAKASIQASISSLEKDKQARQTSAAKLDKQIQSLAGTQELLKQVVIGTKTTSAVVDKVAGNMTKINAGTTQLAQGAKELDTKVTDSKSGLIAQVNGGVSALKNGTSQLREGIGGKNGLANGLNQLASGASQVNSGASTLNEKMAVANSGAKELHKGASQLSAGASQLDSGAGTLVSGLNTLNKGSSALIDGVKKLDAGAVALNDGMIKFNKEGIEKLVSVFDGDIDGLLDKVNTILDSSKNYKNFSGISEDMDGEVKFIFVTE